jgi:hypothetical protein
VENLALKLLKQAFYKGKMHFAQILSNRQSMKFQYVTKVFRFLLIWQICANQISTIKNIFAEKIHWRRL